jgi:hypothetical protein
MSQTSHPSVPAPERAPSHTFQNWAYFGAAVMAFMGASWAFLGLVALVDDSYFVVRTDTNRLLALETYTAWGWAHLIGGLVAVVAGIGVLSGGRRWARRLAVVVAFVSAVVNLGFLNAAPIWATFLIAVDVVIIYALTVHGAEIER